MIHPNEVAINYIFHHFQRKYFTEETMECNKEIMKLSTHLQHRPYHKESLLYRKSLHFALEKMEDLEKKYPFLNYQEEQKELSEELKKFS